MFLENVCVRSTLSVLAAVGPHLTTLVLTNIIIDVTVLINGLPSVTSLKLRSTSGAVKQHSGGGGIFIYVEQGEGVNSFFDTFYGGGGKT